MDLGDDWEPVFTSDGKYLLLMTARINDSPMLARLSLLPEDSAPFEFKDDEETGMAADDSSTTARTPTRRMPPRTTRTAREKAKKESAPKRRRTSRRSS